MLFSHGTPPPEGLADVWAVPEGTSAAPMAMLGQIGPDDIATILYTSGSTGRSKGAWSDHRGVVHGVMSYVAQERDGQGAYRKPGRTDDRSALRAGRGAIVPMSPAKCRCSCKASPSRASWCSCRKWDVGLAIRLMAEEKVTYFVGVPLMSYENRQTTPIAGQYDLSACKSFAAGGAPRPVEHVTRIKEAFPRRLPPAGLWPLPKPNAVGCGNFNENYLAKPGSTGRASKPMVDLRILDDDGNELPQGQVGEVCIRSVANFRGYWKNEEATKAAFTDNGFFRTGDLGYLDQDEYLFHRRPQEGHQSSDGGEISPASNVEDGSYA